MDASIVRIPFSRDAVADWATGSGVATRWPVVYVLTSKADIYIGETGNIVARMRQHLDTVAKQHLEEIHLILDPTANKSVCLDLEAYLIRMAAGDGKYQVLNRNAGLADLRYYQQDFYRRAFPDILEHLRRDKLFNQSVAVIQDNEFFRLSPFKTLTEDQESSVRQIVQKLLSDLQNGTESSIVIQGDPGTGKTVVAIFLIKLLVDIGTYDTLADLDSDATFFELFTPANRQLLRNIRLGMVIPQQSLRTTVKRVFDKMAGLKPSMILSPFDAGQESGYYDLLLVDEMHRLNQRASQASGKLNQQFRDITIREFGSDDKSKTQLDWVRRKSRHQIYCLDVTQSVRPADLPYETLLELVADARRANSHFQLKTQMRIQAGSNFVSYVRRMLDPTTLSASYMPQCFDGYDFRMFEDIEAMKVEIERREGESSLARLVAGYAWEWKSKKDKEAYDIEIGQTRFRWNSTQTDWVASKDSRKEVGSVHVVQGYDLNYAGIIIGPDLCFDSMEQRFRIDRASYYDERGKRNNRILGITYTDSALLRFVTQIYTVLLTRGIRGTYVYACDDGLRDYLRAYIPTAR